MVTHTQAGPLIALRGSGEKTVMRVNILQNGMPINTMDESMGVIPFNAIPVSTIEKIEIIPGGGVTLYGSGSSSGVINIVTNKDNKSSYGTVSADVSSLESFGVQVNKGIKLGEKVFLDLAVEGQKGHGYRDEERHEKVNLIGGIDYKLNDKHKFRLEGTKYIANNKSTDELSLNQLKKNRKGAGKSDFDVDSDRDSFTARYEYTPNKKWNVSAAYNQSDFTRNIKQNNRPFLTFLPSEGFNMFFGSPKGFEADYVLKDVYNKLDGSIREKVKNFKFKTDYKYDRGNLVFGYDKSKHKLARKMHIVTEEFYPKDKSRYLMRPVWETVLDEELLEKREKEYLFIPEQLMWIMFGRESISEDIDPNKVIDWFNKDAFNILVEMTDLFDSALKDPEKRKILKRDMREDMFNDLLKDVSNFKDTISRIKKGETTYVKEADYTEWSYTMWKMAEDFSNQPLSSIVKDGVTEARPTLKEGWEVVGKHWETWENDDGTIDKYEVEDEEWVVTKGKPVKVKDIKVEDFVKNIEKELIGDPNWLS